jgi:hypothetical protein
MGTTLAGIKATTGIPPHIATPDSIESSLGTLEFKDGAPSKETIDKVYDHLDACAPPVVSNRQRS